MIEYVWSVNIMELILLGGVGYCLYWIFTMDSPKFEFKNIDLKDIGHNHWIWDAKYLHQFILVNSFFYFSFSGHLTLTYYPSVAKWLVVSFQNAASHKQQP